MMKPVLLHDTKRSRIYQYGKDGKITVSKRLTPEEEVDYLDLLESGLVEIQNCSSCKSIVDLCGYVVDPEALAVLDVILGEL